MHPFLRADQRANHTAPSPATMIAAIASSPPCRESECNSAKDEIVKIGQDDKDTTYFQCMTAI